MSLTGDWHLREEGKRSYFLMDIEFQPGKINKVLEMGSSDGCTVM